MDKLAVSGFKVIGYWF